MAQLQRMGARLDTLSTKLYQVNVRVGHITWRQAAIGNFAPELTPSPPHLVASDSNAEDDDDDDGDDDDASDDDGDASSTDEMSTWHSTLYHSWQKGGVVLDMRVNMRVVTLRGRVSFWVHCVRGSVDFFEGCSEDIMYLFFSFFIRYIDSCTWGLVTVYRHTLYLFSLIYCWCMFFFHLPFHVFFLFSLYTHASY